LNEYFAAKQENSEENENNTTNNYDNNSKRRNKSTFIPPSSRDSNLDFYIEAITNEILSDSKHNRYKTNLSPEGLKALETIQKVENIIMKTGKSSLFVNRQLENDQYRLI
jgi:peptidase E